MADLLERLVDFDHHGLTATERVAMRMEAWKEIKRLQAEIARSCDDMRFEDSDGGCPRALQTDVENKNLKSALDRARSHIVTLGGGYNGQAYGDRVHQAVLEQIDKALSPTR